MASCESFSISHTLAQWFLTFFPSATSFPFNLLNLPSKQSIIYFLEKGPQFADHLAVIGGPPSGFTENFKYILSWYFNTSAQNTRGEI